MSDADRPRIDQFNADHRSNGTLAAANSLRNPDRVDHVATSERIYTDAESEYLAAVQDFKSRTGRKYPTFSELFRVMTDLGYKKPE